MKDLILLIFIFSGITIHAQQGSDIWLINLKVNGEDFSFSEPLNITAVPGYDNQPSFSPDSKFIYFSSIRNEDQSDIYRWDIEKKSLKQITNTKNTSEYSPQVIPHDKENISVVMVEEDSVQRLWEIEIESGKSKVISKKIDSVGYYSWLDDEHLVFFILGKTEDQHYISRNRVKDKESSPMAVNIDHCFQKTPGERAANFVVKEEDGNKIYQLGLTDIEPLFLVNALPGSKDFAWLPGDLLIMGKEDKLYYNNPYGDKEWKQIEGFSFPEINQISRIAIGPYGRKMAIVTKE